MTEKENDGKGRRETGDGKRGDGMISLEWYRKFLALFAVAFFYTSFADFTEAHGVNALTWIMVLGGLTAPALIHAAFESRYRLQPLIVWALGYLLISIVWYFPALQDKLAYREMRLRFLSMIFLCLMLFIFNRPEEQRFARYCVAVGVLVGVGMNIYELFHPMTFSPVPGRSMGLYSNINQSGCALLLGMIVSQPVLPKRIRLPFSLIAAAGIVTTFSRGAILGWIVVMGFWAIRSGVSTAHLSRALVVLGLLLGFFSSSYWGGVQHKLEERGAINANVITRLQFFSKGNTDEGSAQERESIAGATWRIFAQHPWLGQGTGAQSGRPVPDYDVGPHNIYLAMMVDYGFLGAFLWPLMLLATAWGCRKKLLDIVAPFVIFGLMEGFFSHNIFSERYLLLTVALVASMVLSERRAAEPARAAVRVPAAPIFAGAPA
jgi:hypothetical protein